MSLDWIARRGGPLCGRLRVPGDKSISHRALMLAAIAEGNSHIRGFLEGEDTRATARILQQLGVRIDAPSPGEGACMRTPSCCRMRAVARVSSPSRKPRMCAVPSAIALSMRARCEIDLSPGTRSRPRMAPPRRAIQSRLTASPRRARAAGARCPRACRP
jgi:hypothetical protein